MGIAAMILGIISLVPVLILMEQKQKGGKPKDERKAKAMANA